MIDLNLNGDSSDPVPVTSPAIPVLPGVPYPDPCPFCGSAGLAMPVWQNLDDTYSGSIQCKECMALGPMGDPAPTPEQAEPLAIAKWNARTATVAGSVSGQPPMGGKAADVDGSNLVIDVGIGI